LASVHDDILRLPQGYETEVGERGVMLSGGQKQRISIARALLLNAEILILDDALSAVDGRTEHQILHNLRQWGDGRTVIISAHRLSALTEASEILVMQHGHIAQRGQHDRLPSSRAGIAICIAISSLKRRWTMRRSRMRRPPMRKLERCGRRSNVCWPTARRGVNRCPLPCFCCGLRRLLK
jgi:ABC-type multidrug transport system ATPase subunit